MVFREINFSPFASNVLDYIGKTLVTYTGKPVNIAQSGTGFTVTIGSQTLSNISNLEASYFLNQNQTGEMIPARGYTR